MKIVSEINLDIAEDEWGDTIEDLIKDEIKSTLRAEIKKALKNDAEIMKAVRALRTAKIKEVYEQLESLPERSVNCNDSAPVKSKSR